MLALAFLIGSALLVVLVWRLRPRSLLVPAAIALFALAPLSSPEIAGEVMLAHGCRMGAELSVDPCIVRGMDLAWLLQEMGVFGFAVVLTLPVGVLALLFWLGQMRWPRPEP